MTAGEYIITLNEMQFNLETGKNGTFLIIIFSNAKIYYETYDKNKACAQSADAGKSIVNDVAYRSSRK